MSDLNFDIQSTSAVSDTPSPNDLDYEYQLSENVVDDLIEYTRSRTVKNEQQFVLTALGYISGFMDDAKHFVPGVLIGTAGSGKSHLQNTVAELFDDDLNQGPNP